MSDQYRVALVGTGGAGERMLEIFSEHPACAVVALADNNPARLAELGPRYGVQDTYTDFKEMLPAVVPDIVATATPNFLHAQVALAAFDVGAHVLTEKPLARNTEEGQQMVAAATQADRVLMMIDNQRRATDVETLKTHIDVGGLGRLYHAKAHWLRRSGIPGRGNNWFTQRALSGGGPLIDLGVHVLDMALHLMDEPDVLTVSAATYAEHGRVGRGFMHPQTGDGPHDVEDFCTAFIRLSGGATLTLDVSWEVYGRQRDDFGVALYGTEGGAEISVQRYDRTDTLRVFSDLGGVPTTSQPRVAGQAGRVAVIDELMRVIASGNYGAHHGQNALKRTRILDACYQSASEQREIVLG